MTPLLFSPVKPTQPRVIFSQKWGLLYCYSLASHKYLSHCCNLDPYIQ